MDRGASEDVPVLIVGGSLVGLAAALFLRHHGVDVLAVERHAGTAINARARHFHLRTVEILRSAGLEDAIRRKSQEQYPPDGGINNVESLAGREIANYFPNLNAGVGEFSARRMSSSTATGRGCPRWTCSAGTSCCWPGPRAGPGRTPRGPLRRGSEWPWMPM